MGVGKNNGAHLGEGTGAGQNLTYPYYNIRNAHSIPTKLDRYISLVMLPSWLDFWGILSETFFNKSFCKISNSVLTQLNILFALS